MGRVAKESLRVMSLAPTGEVRALGYHALWRAQSSDSAEGNEEKLEFWEPCGPHICLLRVSSEKWLRAEELHSSRAKLGGDNHTRFKGPQSVVLRFGSIFFPVGVISALIRGT